MLKIAIVSPATVVKPYYIDGAVHTLHRLGHDAVVMPHAKGPASGTFAAGDAGRLADLRAALEDPSVDAILCARGGYGCVHLLSSSLEEAVRRNPKPLIGFSDVSALHALWQKAGVTSYHASMAKQFTLYDPEGLPEEIYRAVLDELPVGDDAAAIRRHTEELLAMLEGKTPHGQRLLLPGTEYDLNTGELEGPGNGGGTPEGIKRKAGGGFEVTGRFTGGNLAVLNGLAGTPWDVLRPEWLSGRVLFLEDIGEKIYQVERMVKRLQLSGALYAPEAILFGAFTEYRGDANFGSMEEMLSARLREWGVECPVLFGLNVGHVHDNRPILI